MFNQTILACELVPNNTVAFVISVVTTLSIRVCEGYDRIVGFAIATAPPAAIGTLNILQSSDGTNFDHTDAFTVKVGFGDVPFDVKVLARYVKVQMDNGGAPAFTFRIHGLMKINE